MVRLRCWCCCLVVISLFASGIGDARAESAGQKKRVLLIAGPPSHGYGAHEHYAGLRLLEESLNQATDAIETTLVRGWPEDESLIERADAVAIYCDGGARHVAFDHRDSLRKLLKRGGGLVCLHYAVEMVPGEVGDDFCDLLGGHFEINRSVNPHWRAPVTSLPTHPITHGVEPFSVDDEWYFYLKFSDAGKVTPIVQAVAPQETMRRPDGHHSGNPAVRKSVAAGELQTLAWAFEPNIGGRSFGFTGGHHHWNWAHEPVRRLVTNAIRWTAGESITPAGSSLASIAPGGLAANQDEPVPGKFDAKSIAEEFKVDEVLLIGKNDLAPGPASTLAKPDKPKVKPVGEKGKKKRDAVNAQSSVDTTESASEPQRLAKNAVAGLDVTDGLEVTLMASEPHLKSLTNLDVDHRGRVWVCDVMNYRKRAGSRPEGDRILILEDTTGDGQFDSVKTFYQGSDIDSAMGICVLGNEVIVTASPTVWRFVDADGDDVPDSKTAMFTETGQEQHDHSAHSFLFGPDGKLLWNFGNTGLQVKDALGQTVVDIHGRAVVDDGQPLFGGMPFRCNLDGSEFEVLAHNFRNNWETTIDSFGTLWQSDNDDDGNRGTRINFVMEQGNYGYRDELTGDTWKGDRITLEEEIPLRHWHLNDPGVVPNVLQTGAGSPSGICVYEGRLLPKRFWDQVIHCDPGPNVVRAYPMTPDGAGYSATIEPLVTGTRDPWFRPADVCVAPDGSLFVTDWYDPGVGGHRQEDLDRGRLFRIAPPAVKYLPPKFDFESIDGCIEALKNPNLSARYLAWTKLHESGTEAVPALEAMASSENPRYRARAMWLLGRIDSRGPTTVQQAIGDSNADVRVMGIRLAKQLGLSVAETCDALAHDPSPSVRRELALSLRFDVSPRMPDVWAKLAIQHNGRDRWMLEALGIGSDERAAECFDAWINAVDGQWNTPEGRDIVWRVRADDAAKAMVELIADPTLPLEETNRYFRSLEYHTDAVRAAALQSLLSVTQ